MRNTQDPVLPELDEIELGLRVQGDKVLQEKLLPGVSRTFACAVPSLPGNLRVAACNGYLLGKAVEALEAHARCDIATKQVLLRRIPAAARGEANPEALTRDIAAQLGPQLPPPQRELLRNLGRLLRTTQSLNEFQGTAVKRYLADICEGSARLLPLEGPAGLPDLTALDQHAYCRSGAMTVLLTQLFSSSSAGIARRGKELLPLAEIFGQGLQTTFVLKTLWKDRAAGLCRLPRDLFLGHGCALAPDAHWAADPGFRAGLDELIARTHGQLRGALDYVLLIPPSEEGIRRFVIWPLALALLTLRKVHGQVPDGRPEEVRLSRLGLRLAMTLTRTLARHDSGLRAAFWVASLGLPRGKTPSSHDAPHDSADIRA